MRKTRERVFILLIIVMSLISIAQASTPQTITKFYIPTKISLLERKTLEMKLSDQMIGEVDSGSKNLFFIIEAEVGQVRIRFQDSSSYNHKDYIGITSRINLPEVVVISKKSKLWPKFKEVKKIFAEVQNLSELTDSTFSFSSVIDKALYAPIGKAYRMNVEQIEELKIHTKITHKDGDHQYKFYFESNDFAKGTEMEAWGAKGDQILRESQKDFNFIRFHENKIGFVLDKHDMSYCTTGECDYTLVVKLRDIRILEFYLFDVIGVEDLIDGQHSFGYIRNSGENIFKFIRDVPATTQFSFIPIEGNGQIFVHPGFLPQINNQFYYNVT